MIVSCKVQDKCAIIHKLSEVNNKQGLQRDTKIFQGRGNRFNFSGELGDGRDKNRKNQTGGMVRETIERDDWN